MTATRLKTITSGLSKLPVYGWAVYWTIPETRIHHEELRGILDDTIGVEWMPKKPATKRVIRLASFEGLSKDGLLVKVRDDAEIAAFRLTEKAIDKEHMDVDLDKVGLAVLDKKTGVVRFSGDLQDELWQKFNSLVEIHTEEDIRAILLNYLKQSGALTLRDTGGIYFTKNKTSVHALDKFLEQLPGRAAFFAIPIVEAETTLKQMSSVLKEEMERDFVLAAEEVKMMIQEESKTRTSTFERRLEDFKTLRLKIEMYRDLLKADSDKLAQQLKLMEEEVMEALTSAVTKHPQAAAFPYKSCVRYSGSAIEKHGELGTVVGYPPPKYENNVRVLFNSSQEVVDVSVRFLTVVH